MLHDLGVFIAQSETSDLLIFLATPFALYFVLSYGIFSPWYKHPLGIITLLMAVSLCGLLFLIDYAMITGGRAPEGARTLVGAGLLIGLIFKSVILERERRRGRIERRRLRERQRRESRGIASAPVAGSEDGE